MVPSGSASGSWPARTFYLFAPVVERLRRDEDGTSRLQRRFDQARAPFEQLCATSTLSAETRAKLEALREETNPRQPRKQNDQLLDLPNATPGVTEDVYEALAAPMVAEHRDAVLAPVTLSSDRTATPR